MATMRERLDRLRVRPVDPSAPAHEREGALVSVRSSMRPEDVASAPADEVPGRRDAPASGSSNPVVPAGSAGAGAPVVPGQKEAAAGAPVVPVAAAASATEVTLRAEFEAFRARRLVARRVSDGARMDVGEEVAPPRPVRGGAVRGSTSPEAELLPASGLCLGARGAPGVSLAALVRTSEAVGEGAWVLRTASALTDRFGRGPVATAPDAGVSRALALLAGRARGGEGEVCFLDTETTGLRFREDAYAFMVGLGTVRGDRFEVEQHVISSARGEGAMLDALSRRLDRVGVLVTFNGQRFDVPLLRERMGRAGVRCPGLSVAHVDLLPVSRSLLRGELSSFRQVMVEAHLLGFLRPDDVPGSEAPRRFAAYQRTGDSRLLGPVLAHNRLDVIGMCAMLDRLVQRRGSEASDGVG